ncbi:MAG: Eco57I restriction-modification methylase domain-containing protein [Acidimicrobiia bacterium]
MTVPPKDITSLLKTYKDFQRAYQSPTYKETEVRREFIDPLFTSLGWDVDNSQGRSPATKDVVHEYSLATGADKRLPDYSFRIGGDTMFFVEAKKPSADLREGIKPALQIRAYAWSAKLATSVLTDFEELAIYDCLHVPSSDDSAATGRLKYFYWEDYAERWEELHSLLSRNAVLEGSLDSFNVDTRDVVSVDAAFLDEIDAWRRALAENIAELNPPLTQPQLNFTVQQTIDRIVFLRICEDRGIESEGQLREIAHLDDWGEKPGAVYKQLCELFRKADERYNSGLFYFKKEAGRTEMLDNLTPNIQIADQVLKNIIRRLYFPESPYRFAVFPTDILGQVYEQFLGKVIRLHSRKGAVVEEKPEVKKGGGVYYTATYIVDHIVRATISPRLEGKTPRQVSGEARSGDPLRILDPACGSGSFLIGAYQYLLDWYLESYVDDDPIRWSKGKAARLFRGRTDEWFLTSRERKRILLTHIYGVDIDPQAVEVTKLSLLLKVLEGTSKESMMEQMKLFHERALPDLGANIKCGNSLIGHDYHQQSEFDVETREGYQINAFDWHTEFPVVLGSNDGGFDVVLGNPPYINVRILGQIQGEAIKEYFKGKFRCARKGYDIYVLFVEQGHRLLKKGGAFGMIIPNKIATLDYALECRKLLINDTELQSIVDVSKLKVFPRVGVYPYVITWTKEFPGDDHETTVILCDNPDDLKRHDNHVCIPQKWFSPEAGLMIHGSLDVESRTPTLPLNEFGTLHSGTTGFSAHELAGKLREKHTVGQRPHFDFIVSGNIDRYRVTLGNVRFMKRTFKNPVLPIKNSNMSLQKERLFRDDKIVVSGMTKRLEAAYNEGGTALGVQVYAIANCKEHPLYLLALLNSKLLSFVFRIRFQAKHLAGGYLAINKGQLEQLPIREITNKSPRADKEARSQLVRQVQKMQLLLQKLSGANTAHEELSLQRQVTRVDKEIDEIVYRLYNLSDSEVSFVEEAERIALESSKGKRSRSK